MKYLLALFFVSPLLAADPRVSTVPVVPRSAVESTAYDATSWNGNTNPPAKGPIRNQVESMLTTIATKAPTASPTFTGTVTIPELSVTANEYVNALIATNSLKLLNATASRAAIIAADKTVTNSVTTDTELGYSSGVTSPIQTQLGTKVASTRTISTTSPLTGGGDLSADRTIAMPVATSSANGYLSSTDWSTFNGKASVANPTGTIGLSAVNGSASTALRSDAAPALSQAIAPTWTAAHVFAASSGNPVTITNAATTQVGLTVNGFAGQTNDVAVLTAGGTNFFRLDNRGTWWTPKTDNQVYYGLSATNTGMGLASGGGTLFYQGVQVAGWGLPSANETGFRVFNRPNSAYAFYMVCDQDTALTTPAFQLGIDSSSTPAPAIFKGADGSGTDKVGGDYYSEGGQGTGTGRGGSVIERTTPSSTTSSTANTYSMRRYTSAKAVTLTDATATTFANIAVASSKFAGATLTCTVTARDATDFQSLTSIVRVDAVNKAGTVTATVTQTDNTTAASAGTLTCAYTVAASGNTFDIKANADTSLTPTAMSITWMITALNSDGVGTVVPQ